MRNVDWFIAVSVFLLLPIVAICGSCLIVRHEKMDAAESVYRVVSDEQIPYGISVVTIDGKEYIIANDHRALAICEK